MTLKEEAATVLRWIEAGVYEVNGQAVQFGNEQTQAVEGTRLYTPEQLAALEAPAGLAPTIRLADGTTQMIALDMVSSGNGRVGLLNFASARNPGGGFLSGAKAQEEDLCRCSGLYPCLLECMEYYEVNRNQSSLLYTDYAIFSPNVPFFRTHGTGKPLRKPFLASVITAPAPHSELFLRNRPDAVETLELTFVRRWQNVLRIAHDQDITRLLLGAWGCGAFGGDPRMASRTAAEAIQTDGAGISELVFAIPGSSRRSKANLEAFEFTFKEVH